MKRFLVILSLFLLAVPGVAQKIYIDYDKDADFDIYKTFQFVETGEDISDTDPLAHDRIVEGIRNRMSTGMTVVDSSPDLYVTYHSAEKEETQLNTSSFGYGYGGGVGLGSLLGRWNGNGQLDHTGGQLQCRHPDHRCLGRQDQELCFRERSE